MLFSGDSPGAKHSVQGSGSSSRSSWLASSNGDPLSYKLGKSNREPGILMMPYPRQSLFLTSGNWAEGSNFYFLYVFSQNLV